MTAAALVMRWGVVALAVLAFARPALAHDRWGNGQEVPAWVKLACCDKADVHHVPPEAVHIRPDGYHIDGLSTVTPASKVLPSPDGEYWIFWNEAGEPTPMIYCFFAPLNGV